jgi:hypothetical protein
MNGPSSSSRRGPAQSPPALSGMLQYEFSCTSTGCVPSRPTLGKTRTSLPSTTAAWTGFGASPNRQLGTTLWPPCTLGLPRGLARGRLTTPQTRRGSSGPKLVRTVGNGLREVLTSDCSCRMLAQYKPNGIDCPRGHENVNRSDAENAPKSGASVTPNLPVAWRAAYERRVARRCSGERLRSMLV